MILHQTADVDSMCRKCWKFNFARPLSRYESLDPASSTNMKGSTKKLCICQWHALPRNSVHMKCVNFILLQTTTAVFSWWPRLCNFYCRKVAKKNPFHQAVTKPASRAEWCRPENCVKRRVCWQGFLGTYMFFFGGGDIKVFGDEVSRLKLISGRWVHWCYLVVIVILSSPNSPSSLLSRTPNVHHRWHRQHLRYCDYRLFNSKYQNHGEFPIPKAFAGSQDVSTKIPHSCEFAVQHVVPPLITGISWKKTLTANGWLRSVQVQPKGPSFYNKSPPVKIANLSKPHWPQSSTRLHPSVRSPDRNGHFWAELQAPARSSWEGEHPLPCQGKCFDIKHGYPITANQVKI